MALIITGGTIKDEVSSGYIDFIVMKTSKDKIVLGKFMSIFLFTAAYQLLITVTSLSAYFFFGEGYLDTNMIINQSIICLSICLHLISLGIFLSCYLKGLMNFVAVLFTQVSLIFYLNLKNILELLESGVLTLKQNLTLSAVSLLIPQIIISKDNQIFSLILIIYSGIFLLLTLYSFRRMELKKG